MAAGFRERTLADAAGPSPTAEVEPTAVPTEPLPDVLAQGPAPLLLEATPTLALPPILAASGRVSVQLVIERRAWVRVLVDGTEQYAARAAAGEVLEFQGQSAIEVVTGNGGGVHAFYQGEDTGLMGGFDEAVLRIWSAAGLITPTPTATPAVTATPTPSTTATAAPGGRVGKPRFHVVSLGCAKNTVDSESMARSCCVAGYAPRTTRDTPTS